MSSAVNKEKSKIFETILSSPGMTENCKIVLQLSRKNILLLSRLIEAGLLTKDQLLQDEILQALEQHAAEEFRVVHEEILKKAELTDFYERIKLL